MILYGDNLIQKIRNEFDKATKRIWTVVPFIGNWNAVKKIMGTKWITNDQIDIRLITDIKNEGFINSETIKQFLHKGEARTLDGLHAKIYIIDDVVFITSANLTETAFTKRYEICKFLSISSNDDIISVFNNWWKKSKKIDKTWQPRKKDKKRDAEEGSTSGLKKLWNLPKETIKIKNFKDYQDNILLYNDFKSIYESSGKRLLPSLTIYHEVDAFLNFLFHEHKDRPSHKYMKQSFRELRDSERISEVKKYKNEFQVWLQNNQDNETYRKNRITLVQNKLDKNKISGLSRNDLEDIVFALHTMNSHALNRHRFLNPQNNDLEDIKEAFQILLHGNQVIEERMEICDTKLNWFSKSSISELVSWFYPNDYPIMNGNSNCGLKFFGYDINTY
jgi:hypothetical protein